MTSTISTIQLLSVPMAPLLGAVLTGIWGTKLGGNLLGRKACHSITILGVLVALCLSVLTLTEVHAGARYNQTIYEWMVVGKLKMEVGFMVDGLTAMMMCVVTAVSLMVHIYTIGYMQDDEGYNRFFSYISLFTFAMLMLVMSNNLLQLFFGWEAVGLVSYLLIGFWYQRPTAIFANMKAFLVNRVGDFGFILGIGLLVGATGSLAYTDIFAQAPSLVGVMVAGTPWMLLSAACICLFIGAMGKSAQFPLHVWLPDSMEGPTPISALIHAATMVTAGIFMVARLSPLYELSDAALNFIIFTGTITAFFMGLMGLVQTDIKRVVAYSTLSQLGYMTVALGVSAYSVAVFHLMTHAFFKALLFLAAGSVIIGMHHDQDIRNMGGLRKYMPITWITSLLGSLALIGAPFFSGFFSKESIIEAAHASHLPAAHWAYWALMAGVFVTALYSFRMFFMVFHGKERFRNAHAGHDQEDGKDDNIHGVDDDKHGHHGGGHSTPHESPPVVWIPLVLLAIPSVIIGFLAIGPMLFGDFFNGAIVVDAQKHPAMQALRQEFHGAWAMGLHAVQTLPFWLAALGVALAYFMYVLRPGVPEKCAKLFAPIVKVLDHKYYMDWINENIIAKGARGLGYFFWKVCDQGIIDGFFVNGTWKFVGMLSKGARKLQTGLLNQYAWVMVLGVIVLLAIFVSWPLLSAYTSAQPGQ